MTVQEGGRLDRPPLQRLAQDTLRLRRAEICGILLRTIEFFGFGGIL